MKTSTPTASYQSSTLVGSALEQYLLLLLELETEQLDCSYE